MPKKKKETNKTPAEPPAFSITCMSCDAGQEITSLAQALILGWHNVYDDPEGLYWTHVGNCKECWLAEVTQQPLFP